MAPNDARSPRDLAGSRLRHRSIAIVLLAAHVAIAGLAIWVVAAHDLNPAPHKSAARSGPCAAVLSDDDLMHLALRATDREVVAQLQRWDDCDPTTVARARDIVDVQVPSGLWGSGVTDATLITAVALAFAFAILHTARWPRWRSVALWSIPFAVAHVAAGVVVDLRLQDLLAGTASGAVVVPGALRWAAAIKLGTLIAAMPVFFVSLALAIGRFWREDADQPQSSERMNQTQRFGAFVTRWRQRLVERRSPEIDVAFERPAPPLTESSALGVCCSGGGIRSAAFNLGALQALSDGDTSELDRARWITSVSGGGYIAAAWVTARNRFGRAAWSRRSAEEQHLRRHASYLAPGIGGKLWLLLRFVIAFAVNLGVVALVVGVVSLPAGWAVGWISRDRPVTAADVQLPRGGCLALADGRLVTVLPGATLHTSADAQPVLDPVAAPVAPSAPTTPSGTANPGPVDACGLSRSVSITGASDAVRAAAPGRRLEAFTLVVLDPAMELPVTAPARVLGCARQPAAPPTTACARDATEAFAAPTGSRLLSAPAALLVVPTAAVVTSDRTLDDACGSRACREIDADWLRWVALALVAVTLGAGVALVSSRAQPSISTGTARLVRRLGVLSVGFASVFLGFPRLVVWAQNGRWWLQDRVPVTSGAGTIALLVALVGQVTPYLGSGASAKSSGPITSWLNRLAARLRPLLIRLAGAVIGPLVVLAIAVAFASYAAAPTGQHTRLLIWLAFLGPLIMMLAGADLNEWSWHPFYRERLKTAFAVDVRGDDIGAVREDPLVGLPSTPELIMCAALNLADDRVTAPGRPVASWVFCKTAIGSTAMAEAPSQHDPATGRASPVADDDRYRRDGTYHPDTLPASLGYLASTWSAVAVSGAAVSPAMGKMTTPERFLLALGNLRLGVWYPNPRYLTTEPWWYDGRHPRPWYLAKEALGLHGIHDRWVYVTDGGHYENLGLVELLRRGAREVYCFDASGDTPDTFGTLADAMRLAREEEAIEIDLVPPKEMRPDEHGISAIGAWAGTITYPNGSTGWLVIAKLSVPRTAPFDVIDLARTLPSFPNHPTADQLYTDQKFEAYRALGQHLGRQAASLGDAIRRHLRLGDDVATAVAKANASLVSSIAVATDAERP